MAVQTKKPRVVVLANREKSAVTEAMETFRPWLAKHAEIVAESDTHALSTELAAKMPPTDLVVILGGDGTLLAQAPLVTALNLPVLGINFGKLGFLAEFNIDDVKRHWDRIAAGQCRTTHRVMIDVGVRSVASGEKTPRTSFEAVALNDAVVAAGAPFRMIELELFIDPAVHTAPAVIFSGDGVIIATPSGSTAYNVGAGGPIVSPDVAALCITPLCPHSLAFRPIVVSADSTLAVRIERANEGSALVIDGQLSTKLRTGDQVIVRRHPRALTLVQNPELSYWKMLGMKMHWAARPRRV
ncbi:MAG: NAD(+)/NADH kinase [Planctomycetes bacterium]|nr:NAD(+)/NADH kinase [Planctomycetota bacterium]